MARKKKHPRLFKYIKDYFNFRTYKQVKEVLDSSGFKESDDCWIITTYFYLNDN